MSSRREVLIRILALLQRKTLLETKNRTLKCLKRHCSTVQSMKNVAVLMEDGAFALFFRPHPGGFDSSRVLIPENLPSKGQNKCQCPGVSPGGGGGGWTQLELTDALWYHLYHWEFCIGSFSSIHLFFHFFNSSLAHLIAESHFFFHSFILLYARSSIRLLVHSLLPFLRLNFIQ